MDRYYCGQRPRNRWVATQLVRQLADPQPSDEHEFKMSGTEAAEDWAKVRQRCLSVAVAMLEEAK
jgi:RND superfamily putative drug exporter